MRIFLLVAAAASAPGLAPGATAGLALTRTIRYAWPRGATWRDVTPDLAAVLPYLPVALATVRTSGHRLALIPIEHLELGPPQTLCPGTSDTIALVVHDGRPLLPERTSLVAFAPPDATPEAEASAAELTVSVEAAAALQAGALAPEQAIARAAARAALT